MQPAVREFVERAYAEATSKPSDAIVVQRLGMALQAHGQNAAAEATYARASALDPSNAATLYYWAQLLAQRGDHAGAVQRLRSIPHPGVAPRLALANALRESGDRAVSAALCRELTTEDPRNATAQYLLGRATDDPAAYAKAVELFPRYGAARFALAALYRKQGQADLAAKLLESYEADKLVTPTVDDPYSAALAEMTISPAGLLRRAVREEAAGRLTEAAALQRQALALQADLPDAIANLISLEARLGNDAAVEETYKKAAANNTAAHYNFGVYCLQRQRIAPAQAAFRKTLDLAPRHADAAFNLAGLALDAGNLTEATTMLQKAIQARPAFAQAHFQLGRLLLNQGRATAALSEFEQAAKTPESEAGSAQYLYAWGATLMRTGDRVRGTTLLQQAEAKAAATGQGPLAEAIRRDLATVGK